MSRMFVVETDDDRHLGFLRFLDGELHVTSGSAGHPVVVRTEDLVSITLADDEHPDVIALP